MITTHVKDICKIGQGHDCCRYLVMGSTGFACAKYSSAKSILDARVKNHDIVARGDNCDGYAMTESIKQLNNKP